jgi:hypothetical protein
METLMIIRLPSSASKLNEILQRLRRNSVVLEQPDDEAALGLVTSGVRVVTFSVAESGRSLETSVRLRFEKDRAAVLPSVNPALLGILGYSPAIPTVIHAGNWPTAGELLSVGLSDKLTPAQAKQVDDLEYLLDLHVVPVGVG